jgi:Lrp/AsnC family leucine-responsive transcriptional regulator
MMQAQLDHIDLQILRLLQENVKISNIQLSAMIGLSPAPTLERVKKLEKAGIIKNYHAELNREALGLNIQTFMQITLSRHKNNAINNFIEQINGIENITECYHITGSSDYLLKIVVKDMPAYERLVMDKLSKIEEIAQMQTQVILSTVKKSNTLPLNYNK